MATAHNEANYSDIAKIVITSGDPKRCEYIAKKFLTNTKLVNDVRGMTAYTGKYNGKEITVFPMGMGMPSLGVYAYELYKFYNVDSIIRIGTCGTINDDVDILDLVLLDSSYTESNFALAINRDNDTHISYATKELNNIIEEELVKSDLKYEIGSGICSEVFDVYLSEEKFKSMISNLPKNINFLVSEMEAFALFYIANMLNKSASCLLTVVDSRYNKTKIISSKDRETKLDDMIITALNASLKL